MKIERYSRTIVPSNVESVPPFLNNEHLKLERVLDGLRNALLDAQPAIANDTSGAANQATVNLILAALRAYGIIKT